MRILVLNSGSSSQKSCLYELRGALPDYPPEPLWQGRIEWGPQGRVANLEVKQAGVSTIRHRDQRRPLTGRRMALRADN